MAGRKVEDNLSLSSMFPRKVKVKGRAEDLLYVPLQDCADEI